MKPENTTTPEVTLTIDGKTVKAPAGTNLVDLAKKQGVEIPHYCYHPALKVAGNCRMCLVEIDGMPNPQIACNMPIKDGLVVHTQSSKAVEARKWTLEFLLANHPLDCPVCDKAGECDLQNYSYKYGKPHSDFVEKKRTPATVKLSPKLWIEKDRCIVCQRCVQFLRDVGGKEELYIHQRGNACEIATAPGKEVESAYQLNTVDICPVGALSSNGFRFAERVWNLKRYESVCPMCPRGCNINVDVKDNQVHRVTPRFNAEVNSYWMCDDGRDHFKKNHNNRTRQNEFTSRGDVINAETAISTVADLLKQNSKQQITVLVSNWLCNEDLQAIDKFIGKYLPKATVLTTPAKEGGDNLLRRHDFGPNSFGVRNIFKGRLQETGKSTATGNLTLSFGLDPVACGLSTPTSLVFYGPYQEACCHSANVCIPGVAHGEIDGSYTNFNGVTQSFTPFLSAADKTMSIDELLTAVTAKLEVR